MTRTKILLASAITFKVLCSDFTAYHFRQKNATLAEENAKLVELNTLFARSAVISKKQAEYLADRFDDAGIAEEFDIIALNTIPEMF